VAKTLYGKSAGKLSDKVAFCCLNKKTDIFSEQWAQNIRNGIKCKEEKK